MPADSSKASKIYTRGGDKGKTSLIGGTRASKGALRLEVYGTVDEFNGALGLAASLFLSEKRQAEKHQAKEPAQLVADRLPSWMREMQSRLFDIGSQLACEDEAMRAKLPNASDEDVESLEKQMDEMSDQLAPLKNFILPQGTPAAAAMHVARTVCRRAERLCVRLAEEEEKTVDPVVIRYLNRASDWCFVAARLLNCAAGNDETIWTAKTR